MRVAIVGGGITGQAAAFEFQKAGGVEVTLIEAAPRLGGKLQAHLESGLLVEKGPDSVFTAKPAAIELIRELGLEAELIEPLSNEFSILHGGKLCTVPRELASFQVSEDALSQASFLSDAGRRRAAQEVNVAPGTGDESVACFFRRRFGAEFSKTIAEPLMAGTHAGDPEKLSMAALFPSILDTERKFGSLSGAPRSGAKVGFVSLRGGMASLTRRLSESLESSRLLTSCQCLGLSLVDGGARLETTQGSIQADRVLLTVPAFESATLLRGISPSCASALEEIRFVSTAIATFAFPRKAFREPPTGNGFLVPYDEPCVLSGCTWSSNKWPRRAPDDVLLLRAFLGRDGGADVDRMSDSDLMQAALEALRELHSFDARPLFSRIDRWPNAMPQYEMGHLERLAKIEQGLKGLHIALAGAPYRGNSIPDCIRQGREAARRIVAD